MYGAGGMNVEPSDIEAAVLGGLTLGGGGGGLPSMGLKMGQMARKVGRPRFIDLSRLRDDEYVVCVSAVGAPAAQESVPSLGDFALALQMMERVLGRPIGGLMTNENGALSTLNAYMASAVSGIPVVDLAANGRAHPTTTMGAMGLELIADYESVQVVVAAEGATGRVSRIAVQGSLDEGGRIVRDAAAEAGGLVIVARNPVTVAYAKEAGVQGAFKEALRIGKYMLDARARGHDALRDAAKEAAHMRSIAIGTVQTNELMTEGGFDAGLVTIAAEDGHTYELPFLNEFMIVDRGASRLATFPDLINLLDMDTGLPLTTVDVVPGMHVEIAVAPRRSLLLGRGMSNPELFRVVEETLQRPMIRYIFPEDERAVVG